MKTIKNKKILVIVLSFVLLTVIALSASIFGRTDWNNLKDKIDDLTQKEEVVETKNYIYNADFSINTTGISVFTEENCANETKHTYEFMDGYVSDTGINSDCDFELYSVVNGLYVKNMSETANVSVSQYIRNSKDLIGNDVTMSFSYNGVIYVKTFNFVEGEEYKLSTGKLCYTLSYTQNSVVIFTLKIEPGFEGVINWIQLELGNIFTGFSEGPVNLSWA